MKKVILMIALMACLAACNDRKANEQSAQTSNDSISASPSSKMPVADSLLIVSGKRVGNIVRGQTSTKELADSLGAPISGDAAMGETRSTYRINDQGQQAILTVFASRYMGDKEHQEYLVESIRTTAAKYKLAKGLGVGSSMKAIQADYPLTLLGHFTENNQGYQLYDTTQGVSFEIGDNQQCHGIMIHNSDEQATDTYLPIYSDFNFVER